MIPPYERGWDDAVQDAYENAPFASTGGLGKRAEMKAPDYVPEDQREEYLRGYKASVEKLYGPDWQTVSFSWKPALTIP